MGPEPSEKTASDGQNLNAASLENATPKMPRKAVTMKIDVRTLLSTGLLEGVPVKYFFQKHQGGKWDV
ncbi:hypothetical protein QJS10_CPA03g01546 [Acorus calamus]|uniref:Uncharacterized protein n=1 Tax=Acorus calamus TaxID=4465 RepID=A0AAV9F714_ACOCL|nr:hypothetical protein QJS10_CPA03g01546 [Acorus calamus]